MNLISFICQQWINFNSNEFFEFFIKKEAKVKKLK